MHAPRLKPEWFLDWHDECVAIVAAGPSLTQADVDALRDRIHVCAVNTSYQLCKWADVLYACDIKWWEHNRGAPDFKGLKVTREQGGVWQPELKRVTIRQERVHRVSTSMDEWVNEILVDEPGTIGSGANSGFQAINIMVQFGCTGILLLGFDYKSDAKGKIHWHGRHETPLHNPVPSQYKKWIEHLTRAAPRLQELGVDVVNCSPFSAIECFPKMSVQQALRRWTL